MHLASAPSADEFDTLDRMQHALFVLDNSLVVCLTVIYARKRRKDFSSGD